MIGASQQTATPNQLPPISASTGKLNQHPITRRLNEDVGRLTQLLNQTIHECEFVQSASTTTQIEK
jgi:hypothetical protein